MTTGAQAGILLLLAAAGSPLDAQQTTNPLTGGVPREIARTIEVESRALGETRTIDVTLPVSYGQGTSRYPVLVVLDGESLHPVAASLARFFAGAGQLPEMIVVGVRNTQRIRDLTPQPKAGWNPPPVGSTGGAARFATFLADELLPSIDRSYRTQPFRTIVGHSLGGLFALDLMVERPAAFGGYVVLDPSAWWNERREYERALQALRSPALRHVRAMLVNAPSVVLDTTTFGGRAAMVRYFRTPGEDHASMPVAGMMQGLRAMFADWLPRTWQPGTRPIVLVEAIDSLSVRMGFDVPVPEQVMTRAFGMSLGSRYFDDAERIVTRFEKESGSTPTTRQMREQLAESRRTPVPSNLIPLEFPATRPSAKVAAARQLLGTWRGMIDNPDPQVDFDQRLVIAASGDTIEITSTTFLPTGPREGTMTVIGLGNDGTLEWAIPLRGVAGVEAYVARLGTDGTLSGHMEFRGFPPPGGRPARSGTRFTLRRVASP